AIALGGLVEGRAAQSGSPLHQAHVEGRGRPGLGHPVSSPHSRAGRLSCPARPGPSKSGRGLAQRPRRGRTRCQAWPSFSPVHTLRSIPPVFSTRWTSRKDLVLWCLAPTTTLIRGTSPVGSHVSLPPGSDVSKLN